MVLNVVRQRYPVSRHKIAELTELSVPSVSRILNRLLDEGFVEETDSPHAGLGRKTKLITLKDGFLLTAGVEYDGDTIKSGIVDEKGHIISSGVFDIRNKGKNPALVAKEIYSCVKFLFDKENIPVEKLFGIGLSLPGIIDFKEGVVVYSSTLNWNNVNLKSLIEEISGTVCVIDNDIKSAAYAEYNKGNAKGSKISALIYYGSGLGSAVVIDGTILRGVTNSAGEIGHITKEINGILCTCGKIGCLQTSIARNFILDEVKKVAKYDSFEQLFDLENRRDKSIERIAQKFVTYSAIAVDTAVCAYNPDAVILCGDVISADNGIFEEICDAYYQRFMCDYLKGSFTIKKSAFNGNASLLGVGLQAAEKFFQSIN
jgi:predicted NBD/HSP70 family sugar kinase